MSNIMAAIGRVKYARAEELVAKRQLLARRYVEILDRNDKARPFFNGFYDQSSSHISCFLSAHTTKGKLRDALKLQVIETGIHCNPNHSLSFCKQANRTPFPFWEKVLPNLLALPIHNDLELIGVDFVINTLNKPKRKIR